MLPLQAARSKTPINASVTLMDDRSVGLQLDSLSTSGEVCQALASSIDLRDAYGFSLYISLYDKVRFTLQCVATSGVSEGCR